MTASVATRRRLIRKFIGSQPVASQQELVAMLESAGHFVTQATVSRDLDAIGAIKVRTDGGALRYEIFEDPAVVSGDREMTRIIDEFADAMEASGNLLVIKTRPGAAHVVGAALDRARIDGILGTVAGDDTVLVVASEHTRGQGVIDALVGMGVER